MFLGAPAGVTGILLDDLTLLHLPTVLQSHAHRLALGARNAFSVGAVLVYLTFGTGLLGFAACGI